MKRIMYAAIALAVLALGAPRLCAMDAVGLKVYSGYPYPLNYEGGRVNFFRTIGIGTDLHLSSRFALEPGLFLFRLDKSLSNSSWTSDSSYKDPYFGAYLGAFYTLNVSESLFVYFGPRGEFAYHPEDETKLDASTTRYSEFYYGAVGVFGLRYMFGEHFGVFGDLGLGYYIYNKFSRDYTPEGELIERFRLVERQLSLSSAFVGLAFYL